MYFRDKHSLRQIAKRTGPSRNTIRKWVSAPEPTLPAYQRCATLNKLNPFHEKAESFRPKHNRRSAKAVTFGLTFALDHALKSLGLACLSLSSRQSNPFDPTLASSMLEAAFTQKTNRCC
jgi:transposase